ncbi:hypothetical protein BST97_01405 [Nonlabens spongiae]|uniref:Uncharacterized protein n=1 Tax=Nonlabens spongiae TaxID=331648 RepID=A0A1W6MGN5_9FLAO|nr:hypothetical protein BST97_01405 [Nonlabens spongiae]
MDPDRNGSIVLPDGKSWCDVAQETGSAYAKCKCKHSSATETSKGKMQAEIDNMYAQRDALIDKANKAKRKAYQISLTDDDSNFDTKKQAKIAFLEEYIGYNEKVIGLLKEMNQRFGMKNNVNAIEQDVAHKRAEINRLREKEQSKTHTISSTSDEKAYTSSGQSDSYTDNNQSQESIYQIRQRQAQQYQNARNAQIQRQVEANQRQYQQTMDNNARAKSFIKSIFSSANYNTGITRYVDASVRQQYNTTSQYNDTPKYVEDPNKEGENLYGLLPAYLQMGRYEDFKSTAEKLSKEKYLSTLSNSQKQTVRLLKAMASIGDPDSLDRTLLEKEAEVLKDNNYLYEEKIRRAAVAVKNRLYNSALTSFNNQNYDKAAVQYQKLSMLTNEPYFLLYAITAYEEIPNKEQTKAMYNKLINLNKDISYTLYVAEEKSTGEEVVFLDKETLQFYSEDFKYLHPNEEKFPQTALYTKLIEMHYKNGNLEKAIELLETRLKATPNDSELLYNLGVMNAESGNIESAIENYKKAIEINPDSFKVLLNISATILSKENQIVTQMNGLGRSEAEDLEYNKLSKQRTQVYKDAMVYLEKAHALRPNHTDVVRTLMNIYEHLTMDDKFKNMKIKLAKIKS